MSDERAIQEAEERRRILSAIAAAENQYRREVARQAELIAELEWVIAAVAALVPVAATMGDKVTKDLNVVSSNLSARTVEADAVFNAIEELSNEYFTYKNLSTATKNISQFTEEYYTRFGYYHELRRITLGYVIGLDSVIVSSETARKQVEKAYLQNSEYWLTYCIASVMLWASSEREAAERGVSKALSLEPLKAALFFMLVNVRFGRSTAAMEWYRYYLDRVDTSSLTDEWQFLIHAYLSGSLSGSPELNAEVRGRLLEMVAQVQALNPTFDRDVAHRSKSYVESHTWATDFKFAMLRETCPNVEELRQLLTSAERNEKVAIEMQEAAGAASNPMESLADEVEETLYGLIETMDTEEAKVFRRLKYNELIVAAKGDLSAAQAAYAERFTDEDGIPLGEVLMRWAFSFGDVRVSPLVRNFSIGLLKDWMLTGFEEYQAAYRRSERERYEIRIDSWSLTCAEDETDMALAKYEEHFGKSKWRDYVQDKFTVGYAIACIVAVLILVFVAMSGSFNAAAVVFAVLLGIIGGFLLWRRIVDYDQILEAKKQAKMDIIRKSLVELGEWRAAYRVADGASGAISDALRLFG